MRVLKKLENTGKTVNVSTALIKVRTLKKSLGYNY